MVSLTEYSSTEMKRIDESTLFIDYGKYIDSALHKLAIYNNNVIHRQEYIQEHYSYSHNYDIQLSFNEQLAIKNLFINVLENYKKDLESQLLVEEGLIDDIKDKFHAAKDKGKEIIDSIKTKIKAVNDIIVAIAKGAVKTVKDIAGALANIFEKLNCTVKGLFEKIGIKVDDNEIEEFAAAAAKKTDAIQAQNIYESYGNELKLILEAEDNNKQEPEKKGETVKKKSTKEMLLKAFKQFVWWFVVCVAVPGAFVAAFPGTWLALFIPLACKALWSGYKIINVYKQGKKLFGKDGEWKNLSKTQKWIQGIGFGLSIIAIIMNISTLASNAGKVVEGFMKAAGGVMDKAQIGVSPDALTKGFAATVNMIKEGKFSLEDFGKAYKGITDSFAEHTKITEYVTKTTKHIIKGGGKIGKDADEVIKGFGDKAFKSSHKAWTDYLHPNEIPAGEAVKKIGDADKVQVIFDGTFSKANSWSNKLVAAYKEFGGNPEDLYGQVNKGFNSTLHHMCKNAGSVSGMELPGKFVKWCINNHVDLGHNSFQVAADGTMKGIGIMGSVGGDIAQTITTTLKITKDILGPVADMFITVPSVEVPIESVGGFRVRLGENGSDNYVYEVKKGDVREVAIKEMKSDIEKGNKSAIDALNEVTKKALADIDKLKEAIESNKEASDKEKNKALKELNKKEKELKDALVDEKVIVYYGSRVKEENKDNKKESKKNESLSLDTYMMLLEEKSMELRGDVGKYLGMYLARFTVLVNNKDVEESDKELWDKTINALKDYQNKFKKQVGKLVDDKAFKWALDKETNVISIEITDDATQDDINKLRRALIILTHPDNNPDLDKLIEDVKSKSKNDKKSDGVDLTKSLDKEQQTKLIGLAHVPATVSPDKKALIPTKSTALTVIPKSTAVVPLSQVEPEDKHKDEPTPEPEDKHEDEKDEGVIPVLFFSRLFMVGGDIAKATDKGPRKGTQVMKGLYGQYEYMTIPDGMSESEIDEMCTKMLTASLNDTFNAVADKPCIKKKGDYVVNDQSLSKPDDERDDFGSFTNTELTELIKDNKKVSKYLKSKGGKVTAAETKDEKKQLSDDKKTAVEKLKNDKKLQKKIQSSDTLKKKYVKDGTIDYDKIADVMAERKMAKQKAKKKKGLWDRILDFFGLGKKETMEIDNLNSDVFESVKIADYMNNSIYERKSLFDYMNEH